MQKIPGPFRVYVGLVPTGYKDEKTLAQTIHNGLLFCNVLSAHNTTPIFLKTDFSVTNAKFTKNAYTNPKFLNLVIQEILKINPSADINLAHDKGIIPSQTSPHLIRLLPKKIKLLQTPSCPNSLYYLSKEDDRASNTLQALDLYSKNPFSIYCPKLKNDFFTDGLGGALRLGFQSEATNIDRRICDMLEICNPKLIITDAIVVPTGGSHATQPGHELGAILIANNALAHDWVACEILHLNPSTVKHLVTAFKRGWGPQNIDQIELGGTGAAGLQLLSQKSKQWIFSPITIDANKFPVEIISKPGSDSAVQSLVLDWLLAHHDVPQAKRKIPTWGSSSLCVGKVTDYPTKPIIYAIGDKAISSLRDFISTSHTWFKIFGIQFQDAQLKNGRWHKLIQIPNEKNHPSPGFRRLSLAFYLGSLGKMKHPLFSFWRSLFHSQKRYTTDRKILTQSLAHNSWWSIS